MATARPPSLFAVDTLLFKPEPPVLPKDVRALFHGREQELQRGLETLKANLDVEGKRSKQSDKRPWVIHGESRSGKSHLARRIFADMPSSALRLQCLISSGGRLDALTVLRDLFEVLRGEFKTRILDERLAASPLKNPDVRLVLQLIEKVGLFTSDVQAVELSSEEGERSAGDLGAELGGAPLLFKFLAKYQAERTQKNTVKLVLRPPTPLDVAEVCGIMVETLLRLQLLKHALLLIDDVDLLEGYVNPQQNARQQRTILANALDHLHGVPWIDVVLTARSWYAHAHKDLQPLVDLGEAPVMTPDQLAGIHDRRFKLYSGKRGPRSFLDRPALLQLAQDVEGLPGVFIQHLQTAFYHFQNEGQPGERDYAWFLDLFRRRLEGFRDRCRPAMEVVETAIRDGRGRVDVTAGNPFFGTVLDNELVYQSYYSETTYFISGLMWKVLNPSSGQEIEATP